MKKVAQKIIEPVVVPVKRVARKVLPVVALPVKRAAKKVAKLVPELSDEQKELAARWRKRALITGVLLAIFCKLLPPDYQGPCHTLASICSGGI